MDAYYNFRLNRENSFESELEFHGQINFHTYDKSVQIVNYIKNLTTGKEDQKTITIPMKIFFNLDKVMEKILL